MTGNSNSHSTRHVVHGTRDRSACFYSNGDYQYYLGCLRECCAANGCTLHAYVLMPDHVHLLMSPGSEGDPDRLMKALSDRYTDYSVRSHGRSRVLWQDAYRSHAVAKKDVLTCYLYIEQNPLRACMVKHAIRYRWSSFPRNAMGCPDSLVHPHAAYVSLGLTDSMRQQHYRELFRRAVKGRQLRAIRDALSGGPAVMNPQKGHERLRLVSG